MAKIKKIFKSIALFVLTLLVILCLYTFVMTDILHKDYANVFGYTYFVVSTGSMSGTIEIHDIIFVKVSSDVKENDIVTFKNKDGELVTHRVVKIMGDKVITKGDINNVEDDPIDKTSIVGKVKLIVSPSFILKSIAIFVILFIFLALINFDTLFQKYVIQEDNTKKESKEEKEEKEQQPILKPLKKVFAQVVSIVTKKSSEFVKFAGEKAVVVKEKAIVAKDKASVAVSKKLSKAADSLAEKSHYKTKQKVEALSEKENSKTVIKKESVVDKVTSKAKIDAEVLTDEPIPMTKTEVEEVLEKTVPKTEPEVEKVVEKPIPKTEPEVEKVIEKPIPKTEPEVEKVVEKPILKTEPEAEKVIEKPIPITEVNIDEIVEKPILKTDSIETPTIVPEVAPQTVPPTVLVQQSLTSTPQTVIYQTSGPVDAMSPIVIQSPIATTPPPTAVPIYSPVPTAIFKNEEKPYVPSGLTIQIPIEELERLERDHNSIHDEDLIEMLDIDDLLDSDEYDDIEDDVESREQDLLEQVTNLLKIKNNTLTITRINKKWLTKFQFVYKLIYVLLVNDQKELSDMVQHPTFEEIYNYDLERSGLYENLRNKIYTMPIYVYLWIMCFAILYNDEEFFDGVFKIMKYKIQIDRSGRFRKVLRRDKAMRKELSNLASFMKKISTKYDNKKVFELDKIERLVNLRKYANR